MFITIGAFDGFHRGHAQLLRICREKSDRNDWAVITFSPHPAEFMRRKYIALFSERERDFIRRVLEIPKLCPIQFDDYVMNLSPEKFWEALTCKFEISGVVVGSDFRFGFKRQGDALCLRNLALKSKIPSENIYTIPLFKTCAKKFSSSDIREKILNGQIHDASEILGYHWFMFGRVIHGDARGRNLGFPTANLDTNKLGIIPADGVYSVAVNLDGEIFPGLASIGKNPTFHDVNETRIEIFLLNFTGDLYGREIPVFFLDRIREIKTFENADALRMQIQSDVKNCENNFQSTINNSKLETRKFLERANNLPPENFSSEIIKLNHE